MTALLHTVLIVAVLEQARRRHRTGWLLVFAARVGKGRMSRRHDRTLAAAITVWLLVVAMAYLAVAAHRPVTRCADPATCYTDRLA